MANKEQLAVIKKGSKAWNAWRVANPTVKPNLSQADLSGRDLRGTNFRQANLSQANLYDADMSRANLSRSELHLTDFRRANLSGANLFEANLSGANLASADVRQADLRGAELIGAILRFANLTGTDLRRAGLTYTDLTWANLAGSDLTEAHIGATIFGDTDLSSIKGLSSVIHDGPSIIGIDTLFKSDGKVPEGFLRGAGIPENFITFVPSLVGRAIEFYSCFISYSHQDEEFSQRLHSRMQSENLRVWYAPEDMKGGRKLHEEIFQAIQIHDKLLLVLSDNSMKSEWVRTEIRRARKVEREENRRKLFPIRLVDFEAIQKWECFDADSGKDLAVEVREYYIPDFSNWKNNDAFESEFAKLLRDLRATAQ